MTCSGPTIIEARPGSRGGVFGFLDHTCPRIAADLALDEALLIAADTNPKGPIACLRLWEPPGYAVVLGASGRVEAEVHREAIEADSVPIARRSSGGGTVVVGPGALNVTVILPRDHAPGLEAVEAAQGYVLERIAASIRSEIPEVQVLGSGDLTLEGRKIAGSAQRRLKTCFLVHATILHDFPLGRIDRYLREPARQPHYRRGRPHSEFVANLGLTRDRLAALVRSAWLSPDADPVPMPIPEALASELEGTKYADPAWTFRF